MKTIKEQFFEGERPLFHEKGLQLENVTFGVGESPLKECEDLILEGCLFKWKYPLWYGKEIRAKRCVWFDMARAGMWYTEGLELEDCQIEAPKSFRRSKRILLRRVSLPHAAETLWYCKGITLDTVSACGDYFALGCEDVEADGLTLYGNYCFDGAKNVTIRNARILSKDAFWNSENVTVYDSFISGEYLGWNARRLTLVNCTVESLQGLCYVQELVMQNCKMLNTTLAFEYSTVEADISSKIDSVFNPSGGRICAASIGKLIIERDKVDPAKTVITCRDE